MMADRVGGAAKRREGAMADRVDGAAEQSEGAVSGAARLGAAEPGARSGPGLGETLGPSPRIKICGLRRPEDVAAVNLALPDFVGFVFAPSRRHVSFAQAAGLARRLDRRIKAVGVFVDAPLADCLRAVAEGTVEMVQLHGSEDAAYIAELKAAAEVEVIKAIGVGIDAEGGLRFSQEVPANADYLLFDAPKAGSGRSFSWQPDVMAQLCQQRAEFILAGGITVDNLDAALALAPWCVDVSSGAERDGCKDAGLIRELTARTHAWRVTEERDDR